MINCKNMSLFLFSKACERIAFYILQFSLIYYLADYFNFPKAEVDHIYVYWKNGIVASMIIGGIIGDFWLGNKKAATLGMMLILLGLILCFYAPLMYMAMCCIALGTGIYGCNLLTMFCKEYYTSIAYADIGLMYYFIAVNIGGFIGVTINGFIIDLGFNAIVSTSLLFYIISSVVLYFVSAKAIDEDSVGEKSLIRESYLFGIVVLLVGIFSMLYVYADSTLDINAQPNMDGNMIWLIYGPLLAVIFAAVYLLIRRFTSFSISKRLWIGFSMIAILFFVNNFDRLSNASFFGMKTVSNIALVIMTNVIYILIIKNISARYWGVAVGAALAGTTLSGWETYLFTAFEKYPPLSWAAIGLSIAICIAMYFYRKPFDRLGNTL